MRGFAAGAQALLAPTFFSVEQCALLLWSSGECKVQSAKCRQGPKCWPSLAEETPHYTQESPAFSAHLPRIVIFIKIIIIIINYHYTVYRVRGPLQSSYSSNWSYCRGVGLINLAHCSDRT